MGFIHQHHWRGLTLYHFLSTHRISQIWLTCSNSRTWNAPSSIPESFVSIPQGLREIIQLYLVVGDIFHKSSILTNLTVARYFLFFPLSAESCYTLLNPGLQVSFHFVLAKSQRGSSGSRLSEHFFGSNKEWSIHFFYLVGIPPHGWYFMIFPIGWRKSWSQELESGRKERIGNQRTRLWNYPLVNIQKTMKHHCFSWVNQLFRWPFSSSQTVSHYQEGISH